MRITGEGPEFDAELDMYQQRQEDEAWQAELRSYQTAARPDADPAEVTFAELQSGDFITNEGPDGRWVKVIEVRGPSCRVRGRSPNALPGEIEILFEVPEPISVSGETRYWMKRPDHDCVLIDRSVR